MVNYGGWQKANACTRPGPLLDTVENNEKGKVFTQMLMQIGYVHEESLDHKL